MRDLPTYADARRALLEVINATSQSRDDHFGREYAIKEAARRLGPYGDRHDGRHLMDAWDDLYRAGVISYGLDMANLGMNWAHVTEHGKATLQDVHRDPGNPRGYLALSQPYIENEPIALSYLEEALDTYNKGSVKASAVMLGCAAEALNLSLRARLRAKLEAQGKTVPKDLDDWRVAVVLRALGQQLDQRARDMDQQLRERYQSYWPAWSGLLRMTRNDVGHPTSIEPVTRDVVHAALLLFHEHARLIFDLGAWVDSTF